MKTEAARIKKFTAIILAYPVALIVISLALNWFVFGVAPVVIALPSNPIIVAIVIASSLLVLNHTWLMTSTELTRLNFNMHATPEEWAASGVDQGDISEKGWQELERRHNAHRNTTENTVYFVLLAFVMSLTTPTELATQTWFITFAVARLGYTFCYLRGLSDTRGAFMSLTLLSLYGLASYLVMSVMV